MPLHCILQCKGPCITSKRQGRITFLSPTSRHKGRVRRGQLQETNTPSRETLDAVIRHKYVTVRCGDIRSRGHQSSVEGAGLFLVAATLYSGGVVGHDSEQMAAENLKRCKVHPCMMVFQIQVTGRENILQVVDSSYPTVNVRHRSSAAPRTRNELETPNLFSFHYGCSRTNFSCVLQRVDGPHKRMAVTTCSPAFRYSQAVSTWSTEMSRSSR